MNNNISERRISNNKLRRKRQLRRNLFICLMTIMLTVCFSLVFFSLKTRAQSGSDTVSYKYYKSITAALGDTIWDYADEYADEEHYDSYEAYIREVMSINHLTDNKLICGQHIIIPYYSCEFIS